MTARTGLFAALEAAAARDPRRVALDDARASLRWGELPSAVRVAEAALTACGDAPVALLAANSVTSALVHLASLTGGRPLVPLPPFFSDEQVRHAVGSAGAACVLTDDAPRIRSVLGGSATPAPAFLGRLAAFRVEVPPAAHRDARITFTSGTTGTPKGVRLGAASVLAVASSLAWATSASPSERHLAILPLSVLLEETGGLLRTLLAGGTVLLPPLGEIGLTGSSAVAGDRLADAIGRRRATSLVCVPQTLEALVSEAERTGAPPSLRFVGVGGATVPLALLERAGRAGVPAFEGYGLTEAASVVALNVPGAVRAGTVGRPLPHVRVRVDGTGEILVAGSTFAGYVGGAAGAAEGPDADGWWRTGDVGRIDDDGFVRVEGRRRNVFITSFGRNVCPEWVESRLLGASSIAQVVVVGEGLPRPVAVVVPRGSAGEVERDLARVGAGLPDYARPAAWVAARRPFTAQAGLATPNGRPLRDAIARLHAGEVARALAAAVPNSTEERWASTRN